VNKKGVIHLLLPDKNFFPRIHSPDDDDIKRINFSFKHHHHTRHEAFICLSIFGFVMLILWEGIIDGLSRGCGLE
jgi:hypothetical protein